MQMHKKHFWQRLLPGVSLAGVSIHSIVFYMYDILESTVHYFLLFGEFHLNSFYSKINDFARTSSIKIPKTPGAFQKIIGPLQN